MKPPARIIRIAVILHTHSTLAQWQTTSRSPSIVRGKRIMALIARKHLGLSYPEIALLCEWGSHATAYDAVRQARNSEQIARDAEEIYASVEAAA